jgi:hypothetical protein
MTAAARYYGFVAIPDFLQHFYKSNSFTGVLFYFLTACMRSIV